MKSKILGLLAVGLLAGPMAGSAATMQLVATSQSSEVSNFTVVFEDDGDGLLQWAEITSFSGATITGNFWAYMLATAAVSNISTCTNNPAITPALSCSFWIWGSSPSTQRQGSVYTQWVYAISPYHAAVPEPGTLALLGLGLAGLGLSRRRKAA